MSDLLLLEIAMYRSWIIDQRGFDLDAIELDNLLRDTRASERLHAEPAELLTLLEVSMQPEHSEALRSLRRKTGFDERIRLQSGQAERTTPS